MAAIDDLNAVVATLQTLAPEVVTANQNATAAGAAQNDAAIAAAVTSLQAVAAELEPLVPPAPAPTA